MDHSPGAVATPKGAPADRSPTWISPPSVTPGERPALLRAIAEPCRSYRSSTPTQTADAPVLFADIRLSDAIESAYPIDEDGSSPPLTSAPSKAESPVITASVGDGHGEPLVPTYIGYLETKKDALLLLEGCLRGMLYHLCRGPQYVASAIQSGHIFIWKQDISAVQCWDDGTPWTPFDYDSDFSTSRETTTRDGLIRKTISVPALGRFYHVVSYFNPWDSANGSLKMPSQDSNFGSMALRTELASQLTTLSPSTKLSRLPRATLETCSPTGHLQLMRSGFLLCLCCTNPGLYEYLLRRRPGDWFPHIPSNLEYWHELSSRDVFRGMKRQELRTQMMWLLLKLIEFSDGRTPSRLLRHQPSDRFSAIQNRILCAEIFRVSNCTLVSFNSFDPARLSIDLARSVLFHQCPKTDPTDLEKWKTGLTQLLPIDPPAHNASPPILGILEQVAIKECEKVRLMSMVYCQQFPNFTRTKNCVSLFLVVCQSIPISKSFTDLLQDWARSADGIKTYNVLLAIHRDALPPDELMLNLSALVSLYSISKNNNSDDKEPSERAQFIDVDRFLKGEITIQDSQVVLRDMVWSFSRAVLHALSPDRYPPYVRFLDSALAAVGTSEQNPDRIMDHHWMKRLLSRVRHADAVAQVWNDVQSVPAPPKKHTEIEKRLSAVFDGKAEDETSNYSTISTRAGSMPLVKHTKDGYNLYSHERRTSLPWWRSVLRALGFGSCGGRSE